MERLIPRCNDQDFAVRGVANEIVRGKIEKCVKNGFWFNPGIEVFDRMLQIGDHEVGFR